MNQSVWQVRNGEWIEKVERDPDSYARSAWRRAHLGWSEKYRPGQAPAAKVARMDIHLWLVECRRCEGLVSLRAAQMEVTKRMREGAGPQWAIGDGCASPECSERGRTHAAAHEATQLQRQAQLLSGERHLIIWPRDKNDKARWVRVEWMEVNRRIMSM